MPPKTRPPGRHPAALLMQIRTLHTWIGMLIAPTVLFMAATGILQVYDLHEAHPGYTPPPLIEKLGVLHKKQTFQARRGPPPEFLRRFGGAPPFGDGDRPEARSDGGPRFGEGARFGEGPRFGEGAPFGGRFLRGAPPKPRLATEVLKAFVAAAAFGLIVSTLLGIWMALRQGQKRLLHALLLLAGTAIPVVLILLGA